MEIFKTKEDIKNFVSEKKEKGQTIGFVPTMGALHAGHISLIEKAKKENHICICSIFVNSIQFNNLDDFLKYPVQPEKDFLMLENVGCDAVFHPTHDEIYSVPPTEKFFFGTLENVMEGVYRKGHFNGVATVVKRLFDIILPDKAYFGEKDFQQLRIIQELVKQYAIPVEIVACPTVREPDGLAMSSRNQRLTPALRKIVPVIAESLKLCSELAKTKTVQEVKNIVVERISEYEELKVDYFEIADENTLQPINHWNDSPSVRAFIAVFAGEVRLIDNMRIIL